VGGQGKAHIPHAICASALLYSPYLLLVCGVQQRGVISRLRLFVAVVVGAGYSLARFWTESRGFADAWRLRRMWLPGYLGTWHPKVIFAIVWTYPWMLNVETTM
jgi:hypothetical protein